MLDFFPASILQAIPLLVAGLVLCTVYGAIWRLYFSPIAGFPGPKLAALTLWYEFYYDVFPNYGQYTFHLIKLHEIYGPIIRINPWELHISDPQFYETLYSSTKKRNKWYWQTRMFGLDLSGFGTNDHNLHRIRRGAVNVYFSKANVRRLQSVIQERVDACIGRLRGLRKSGEVVKSVVVASAFASDVIMMYCFGRSYDRLAAPDFDAPGYEAGHAAASTGNLMKHNIWILRIVQALPDAIVMKMGTALAAFVILTNQFQKQVKETMEEEDNKHEDLEHRTIFHELLRSNLPPEEKGAKRLADDAQAFVVAGGETVAFALTVVVYHLLANPRLLQNLKLELGTAIPDIDATTPLATLENLPYLNGVVKEGLRLSYGVSQRLERIPLTPLVFSTKEKDWVIPAGTPVGMTSVLMHHDESIFPKSKEFKPERWIGDPLLDRYMVSFTKGSRQCLGMNLAYAEMYMWLSSVFRRFGSKEVRLDTDEGVLELVDTDISDVEIASDCFVPNVKAGSHGVRIRILL